MTDLTSSKLGKSKSNNLLLEKPGTLPEKLRLFLSSVFNLEIFPSDIYFLDKLPSEINTGSIIIIFIISLLISAIASYLPATKISKMSTFRALRYE